MPACSLGVETVRSGKVRLFERPLPRQKPATTVEQKAAPTAPLLPHIGNFSAH
jgi:hypothetical protein